MLPRLFLAGLVVLSSACTSKLTTIKLKEESTTTVDKATALELLLGDMGFGKFASMDITQSETLANQGVEPGDIVDVRLSEFTLTVTSPEDGHLGFIESFDVYVVAPDLPEVLIASYDDFGDDPTMVEMELPDVDLTDYATSQSMTFTIDAAGNRPEVDTEIEAAITLDVGVTLQGVANQL